MKAYLLVLGASSAIAKAVAVRFAEEGYNLYLAGRNMAELGKDSDDLKTRFGIDARPKYFDVLDIASHEAFYNSLEIRPGGVVCAVGYLGEHGRAMADTSEMRKIIDTNYSGPVSIINVIANDFETRKEGIIAGISSVAGDRGRQSNYYYGSAKAAFTAYLSGLRNRLFRAGVHVITVKPGFVHTRMTENRSLPAILVAQPEEVAGDIYRAFQKKRDIIYTRWFWKYIMCLIRFIPEGIFKRMSL